MVKIDQLLVKISCKNPYKKVEILLYFKKNWFNRDCFMISFFFKIGFLNSFFILMNANQPSGSVSIPYIKEIQSLEVQLENQ